MVDGRPAGVILYGPPTAGKDTVTRGLVELDRRYALFPRMKAGGGRMDGYRQTSEAAIAELRRNGDVIWENRRYGATYVVDRPGLAGGLATGIPVVHLGQARAVDAVMMAVPEALWLTVELWCDREIALARIVARQTGDTDARLKAYDATDRLARAHLSIDTGRVPADVAARQVHARRAALLSPVSLVSPVSPTS
jgi:guanylate kinase